MQQSTGRIARSMEKVAATEFTPPGIMVTTGEPEGFIPAVEGLGKAALWPLLLTFALAIRFLKVTAEVSGWAT